MAALVLHQKIHKKFNLQNWKKDVLSGFVVAFVSIPISMGYAQIAGLPPVYGLYGSLLPILVFGLLTTTKQFVVGVDAMPAAMVGSTLTTLGIAADSKEALQLVPVIACLTAAWLLLFFFLKAGRIVNYISTPVMGGFISGVGFTIILMQVPKLFGGSAGTGELFVLLYHIGSQFSSFHLLSAVLGVGTVLLILISKKIAPKFPMSIIMMAAGAALTAVFHIDRYGVKLLPEVTGGLPKFVLPDVRLIGEHTSELLILSASIAAVIMAQTLLASSSYAQTYNDKIDNNREVMAYAAMNLAGSIMGCCPINGSVSRTGMADQFGCRSQIMSITASFTMLLVLLFGTGLLKYLPVPVLTGIVIAALIGILDIKLAKRLWKVNKNECFIFMTAFFGVLLFGTIYGVVIGVILSFGAVTIRAVVPPTAFLGVIPGHEDFYSLERNQHARPVTGAVIYRFSGNLFFANAADFQEAIEQALREDTRCVIVDAGGIGNIDVTAADRLVVLWKNLQKRGISFYLTEHVGTVNDQLRRFGAGDLIENGAVRRTITLALRDAGIEKPYPMDDMETMGTVDFVEADERLAEFEWVFGRDAESKMQQIAEEIVETITEAGEEDSLEAAEGKTTWGRVGLFDEDELLDFLELRLEELAQSGEERSFNLEALEEKIEKRRLVVEEKLRHLNPKATELLHEHREQFEEHMRQNHPEEYARLLAAREKWHERQDKKERVRRSNRYEDSNM